MIRRGVVPPVIVACPDGLYSGRQPRRDPHSLYINGLGGRFEDHIVGEVRPLPDVLLLDPPGAGGPRPPRALGRRLRRHEPGDQAPRHLRRRRHAGRAAEPALRQLHRRLLRRLRPGHLPLERPRTTPTRSIGRFYFGLYRVRAGKTSARSSARARRSSAGSPPRTRPTAVHDRPAARRAGHLRELPGRDNFNFDAQASRSPGWPASKGVAVTPTPTPRRAQPALLPAEPPPSAYRWLARHLLPPVAVTANTSPTSSPLREDMPRHRIRRSVMLVDPLGLAPASRRVRRP